MTKVEPSNQFISKGFEETKKKITSAITDIKLTQKSTDCKALRKP